MNMIAALAAALTLAAGDIPPSDAPPLKSETPQAQERPAPKAEQVEGYILDVASMAAYCASRGKILALVAVGPQGNILSGACMDRPPTGRGNRS